MILSRWQLVLTPTPHLHPLPFVRGEASEEESDNRRSYVAPGGRAPPRRFPVFLPS
jgi:hypothetical protein